MVIAILYHECHMRRVVSINKRDNVTTSITIWLFDYIKVIQHNAKLDTKLWNNNNHVKTIDQHMNVSS
jgi:hypothetical protein